MMNAEERRASLRSQMGRSLRVSLAVLGLFLASLVATSWILEDPGELPFLYDLFD
jgi:hypothetical protein